MKVFRWGISNLELITTFAYTRSMKPTTARKDWSMVFCIVEFKEEIKILP